MNLGKNWYGATQMGGLFVTVVKPITSHAEMGLTQKAYVEKICWPVNMGAQQINIALKNKSPNTFWKNLKANQFVMNDVQRPSPMADKNVKAPRIQAPRMVQSKGTGKPVPRDIARLGAVYENIERRTWESWGMK